jgi:polyphosphate kinase
LFDDESLDQEKHHCEWALLQDRKRLHAMLSAPPAAQPAQEQNTITFSTSANWVMRITADKRIEVNERVEVTEAAKKVLEAMQWMLKPTQEREALKLALEALEKIAYVTAMDYEYQRWAREAIPAIKETLAQPAQEKNA